MAGFQHSGGKFLKTADCGISMTSFTAAIILPHMAGVRKCLLYSTLLILLYSAHLQYITLLIGVVLFWYTRMQIDIGLVMVISYQQ